MDVRARSASAGNVIGVGEDAGAAAVTVDVDARLERLFPPQADVALVQQRVLHL